MASDEDRLKEAARNFLESGRFSDVAEDAVAEACNTMVRERTQHDVNAAVKLARRFVMRAKPHGGAVARMAPRSLGWALLVAGQYSEAEKAYLEARQLNRRDPLIRARIDRILIDIYMYLGDNHQARRRANMALRTFDRLKAHADAAKTKVNYGNLLHRQDRHERARQLYEQAATFFRKKGDRLSLAHCNFNLANTLVQLFEFDTAEKLYLSAEEAFADTGFELYANHCLNSIAWLHMLDGNYHLALKELQRCEDTYRRLGLMRGVVLCLLDRAETCLTLNLLSDARRLSREAERRARHLGIVYESAKAAYFYSTSSLLLDRRRSARTALQRARAGFDQIDNQAFRGATMLVAAQLQPGDTTSAVELRKARRDFASAQLPLWEATSDLQLLSLVPNDTAVRRRLQKNRAVRVVPHLYARWQTLLGDGEAQRGRMARAKTHWRRAVDRLDVVRTKLPPIDARSTFLKRHSDPYRQLISSEAGSNPEVAASLCERFRTAGVWATDKVALQSSPERRRAVESLSDLALRVTAASSQIDREHAGRSFVPSYTSSALTDLESAVRHRIISQERARQSVTAERQIMHQITVAANRHPVVQFHYADPDLLAFVHDDGETRCHRYAGGRRLARQMIARWRYFRSRVLSGNDSARTRDLVDEEQFLKQLGDWLWAPLELSCGRDRILVIPDGPLHNLPWTAMIHDGKPLVDRHLIFFSPSIRHYLFARSKRPRSEGIEVFVGDIAGLKHVAQEIEAIRAFADSPVTVVDSCKRQDWPNHTAARLWHYSGHATLRSDNPFYSSLTLVDGPLFAADFRLKRNHVTLVTLAACRSGQHTVLPGEESTGMVRALLEMGARSVLASHWQVSDQSSAEWMRNFYRAYFSGCSIGEAVRRAGLETREKYRSAGHWAAYSVFGAD